MANRDKTVVTKNYVNNKVRIRGNDTHHILYLVTQDFFTTIFYTRKCLNRHINKVNSLNLINYKTIAEMTETNLILKLHFYTS